MSKSVKKSVRTPVRRPRTSTPTAVQREVGFRTARSARGRTQSSIPHPVGASHAFPSYRTVARLRALSLAEQLGIPLSKPVLRRVTDRLERTIKAERESLESLKAKSAEPPAASAPREASTLPSARDVHGPTIVHSGRQYTGASVASSSPSVPVSPFAQASQMLEARIDGLFVRVEALSSRLSPVRGHNGASGAESAIPLPLSVVPVLEYADGRLSILADQITTLIDTLLV